MIRLFRTMILLIVAFFAGILYERSAHADKCLDKAGRMDNDRCYDEEGS